MLLWQSTPALTSGLTAQQDFANRYNSAGVVWWHDFQSANEVNNFRFCPTFGLDPAGTGNAIAANTQQITTDGITGACMEIPMPTGASPATSYWWRPFRALHAGTTTGNGKGTDDPADGGQLTLLSYSPTEGGSQLNSIRTGYYANSSNTGAVPNATYDGNEFWLQFRCKIDPNINATSGNRSATDANGGKRAWITICKQSGVCQEIVTINNVTDVASSANNASNTAAPSGVNQRVIASWYRTTSGWPLQWDPQTLKAGLAANGSQYASQYPATLGSPYNGYRSQVSQDTGNVTSGDWHATWAYPLGQWFTLMFHVVPGTYSGSVSQGQTQNENNGSTDINTQLQVWKAELGEKSFTKIFDSSSLSYAFDWDYGWNALILANYPDSGVTYDTQYYQRFCQVILSRQVIACPQV